MVDKSECSRLELKFIIKFLVAVKCKQGEIYKRMCDVYGEGCFIKKKCSTKLSMYLPLLARVKKDSPRSRKTLNLL